MPFLDRASRPTPRALAVELGEPVVWPGEIQQRILEKLANALFANREGTSSAHELVAEIQRDCQPLFEALGLSDEGDGWGFSEESLDALYRRPTTRAISSEKTNEQFADELIDKYRTVPLEASTRLAADALAAPQVGVTAEALEWSDSEAKTSIGTYRIADVTPFLGDAEYDVYLAQGEEDEGVPVKTDLATWNEAADAAQADYEARILAALSPAPAKPAVPEGWALVPIKITPEMAHALESNFAECTEPSEVHQANWAGAWHQAVLLAPPAPTLAASQGQKNG